jgi:hypothetical protein
MLQGSSYENNLNAADYGVTGTAFEQGRGKTL